jgi:hypothetical protein
LLDAPAAAGAHEERLASSFSDERRPRGSSAFVGATMQCETAA